MKAKVLIAAIFFSGLIYAQETKTDSAKTKNIEAVTLTKQVFKKQSDRFVYDVSNSPIAKGNTTFDILKQTPLVSSTDDKTLKIAGKNNALIYINGRKSNMDVESLIQFLKNTPAENIQKIEVITTPGSEFQVESSDGIINIVLKKKMTDGLNGNMRMSDYANEKFNNSSASVSVNYRKNKLGISASLMGDDGIRPQTYTLKNGTNLNSNQSVGDINDPNKDLGGYLNIDYQLTDNSNIALSWNSWANKSYDSRVSLFNTVKTFDDAGNETSVSYSNSKNKENARSYNNNLNLNYELKTDSLGSKLNLNAAYLNYKRFQSTDNYTYKAFADGTDDYKMQFVYQNLPQIINNFSGTADYIQKFEKDLTISVGGNYNKTKTDNNTQNITKIYAVDANGKPIYDSMGDQVLAELFDTNGNKIDNPSYAPNHFIYDESIYGLYLTLEKKFGEKFSGKIGSRYEITNSLGTSDNTKNPAYARIKRDYNNFLPYLSVNYAINDNNNISYAFSSRMRRPSFWEINPVKNILTENNYTQNDPFVKASSTYNQELTYMFKNSYFLVLNHSYMKDIITQIPLQGYAVGPNGIPSSNYQLRYIRTNFGNRQEMSATLGINKAFFKQYWNTNFNVGVQHNINKGTLAIDPTTGDYFVDKDGKQLIYKNYVNSTSFVIQTNNTIRLDKAKTWFFGINYFYVDNQQIELGRLKELQSLDLNIKKIWNDWTFTVNVNDIFNTNRVIIEDYQNNGNYNYINQYNYTRSYGVTIVYNFGNKKVKKIRDIDNASSDIKSRTR